MSDIICGDSRIELKKLKIHSVDCCITSPPYFGLRDYGIDDEIGQEPDMIDYLKDLNQVFSEVYRVLKPDGSLWLNLGDSYANRELSGTPWRVAFTLQKNGWTLRQDIIWAKPNPMPESVTNRFTVSHEYLFLLTKKNSGYYFNQIKEPSTYAGVSRGGSKSRYSQNGSGLSKIYDTRNKRSVWTIKPDMYKGAHFATFPPELVETCIKAGCPEGGVVLDPFAGTGTTGMVANWMNRESILIELNPDFIVLMKSRIKQPKELI